MTRLPDTAARAAALDAADPLAGFRDRFHLPDGVIYLDGNSLGALPKATVARMDAAVRREWGESLIAGWNTHGWIDLPRRLGAMIAPLVGAAAHEVIVCDSASVNLFKLLAGALALRPGRRVVVSEPGDFPTDLYVAQGLASLGLAELRLAEPGRVADAIGGDVAVVLLPHVHYRSAEKRDMAGVTAAAHAAGALALWDLSHSAGAVEVDLNGAGADLATGCGYKYLNGGPGAPAFAFVAERHQAAFRQPLSGWMGHAAPFDFGDDYAPADGVARLLAGTPPVLSMIALEAGVGLVAEAGMPALAAKSRALSALLLEAVMEAGERHGMELASPGAAAARGSHLAFRHPRAFAICQALIADGVVGDFRAPDVLRLGIAPLYLRHADMVEAGERLRRVLDEDRWRDPRFAVRRAVT